jgi:micrococcal nuclease
VSARRSFRALGQGPASVCVSVTTIYGGGTACRVGRAGEVKAGDGAVSVTFEVKGRMAWVVDGDTIHVRIGPRLEKVRYIGINAPEIPHPEARGWQDGGAPAYQVNRRLVAGPNVRLELDARHRGPYGRLLAY